jgi:hypothetical protein
MLSGIVKANQRLVLYFLAFNLYICVIKIVHFVPFYYLLINDKYFYHWHWVFINYPKQESWINSTVTDFILADLLVQEKQ